MQFEFTALQGPIHDLTDFEARVWTKIFKLNKYIIKMA